MTTFTNPASSILLNRRYASEVPEVSAPWLLQVHIGQVTDDAMGRQVAFEDLEAIVRNTSSEPAPARWLVPSSSSDAAAARSRTAAVPAHCRTVRRFAFTAVL
jgi:hypothetical protein